MAGEAGRLGWWDCEATTSTGQFLVGSLFPRSVQWTGIACALDTATVASEARMPRMPHLHLFALDDETEGHCARVFAAWRETVPPNGVCVWPLEDGPVNPPLLRLGLAPGVPVSHRHSTTEQAVQVGIAAGPHPLAAGDGTELDDRMLVPLITGFLQSSPGRVTVPYLRWDR